MNELSSSIWKRTTFERAPRSGNGLRHRIMGDIPHPATYMEVRKKIDKRRKMKRKEGLEMKGTDIKKDQEYLEYREVSQITDN